MALITRVEVDCPGMFIGEGGPQEFAITPFHGAVYPTFDQLCVMDELECPYLRKGSLDQTINAKTEDFDPDLCMRSKCDPAPGTQANETGPWPPCRFGMALRGAIWRTSNGAPVDSLELRIPALADSQLRPTKQTGSFPVETLDHLDD